MLETVSRDSNGHWGIGEQWTQFVVVVTARVKDQSVPFVQQPFGPQLLEDSTGPLAFAVDGRTAECLVVGFDWRAVWFQQVVLRGEE